MKIGIDLRSLESDAIHRGIGRYAANLVEALSQIDAYNEYWLLLTGRDTPRPKLSLSKNFKYSFIQGPGPGLRAVKYIRIFRLLPRPLPVDRYDLDVMLQVDQGQRVQSRKTPIVCTAHDLIPFKFKEIYQHVHFGGFGIGSLISYVRLNLQWKAAEHDLKSYKKCRKIISISEHTKKDLVDWFPALNLKNIVVIPHAADLDFANNINVSSNIGNLKLDKFLFYVGGADPRKGLVDFTKSLEKLWIKYPDIKLVMSGKELSNDEVIEVKKLKKTISNLSKPDQVIITGFVSDSDLAYLYANAVAFVFPSRYEGFGLPILEAMQAGCPVIAYNNSSIPEVAGDAALLVEDGESMVPAIQKLIDSPSLRTSLIAKGKKQARKFSWEKTARETLRVLEEAGK